MLEFKRTIFEVDIYGEKHEIKKPTGIRKQKWLNDLDEINQKLANKEELSGDEDFNITAKMLEEHGLPVSVFESMEDEHQLRLVNALFGLNEEKKK